MRYVAVLTLGLCAFGSGLAGGQGRSEGDVRLAATERVLEVRSLDAIGAYVDEHLTPTYRESFRSREALVDHILGIGKEVGVIDGVGVTVEDGIYRLHIRNPSTKSVVAFQLEDEPPHRITDLRLEGSEANIPAMRVDWDTLDQNIRTAAADHGFCGSVLAIRNGDEVLSKGYGYADPERSIPVTPETVFAIGSTPIDFTHGAILKLEAMGKLSLSDPLSKYVDDLPSDKRAITLDHLRTGRSGLIDFPGIEGVDENLDISWIDRDEFMRRMTQSELLFEPGTADKHSHMAWGVLAAVIEISSGMDYETFLHEQFFRPFEMSRTGHYPLTASLPEKDIAIGLGGNPWGKVNSPLYWGDTSWLVLGSGGMVSTTGDLLRWHRSLPTALGEQANKKSGVGGEFVSVGGNDRGFINVIAIKGDDMVILCSNSHVEMDDDAAALGEALIQMVMRTPADQ